MEIKYKITWWWLNVTKKEKNLKVSSDKPLRNSLVGAAEGNRTPTPLRAADFESAASASFATAAYLVRNLYYHI